MYVGVQKCAEVFKSRKKKHEQNGTHKSNKYRKVKLSTILKVSLQG